MNEDKIVQHVTNPGTCIQCSACEMACPNNAIENIAGRFCIDYSLCKNCGKCIKDCPTGAADSFLQVTQVYSIEQQAQWSNLPDD